MKWSMDASAVRGLGILAEKQGDLARALELYERFVILDPLNLATPTIRQRIKTLRDKGFRKPAAAVVERDTSNLAGPPPAKAVRPNFPGLPPRRDAARRQPAQNQEGWLGDGSVEDWYQPGG